MSSYVLTLPAHERLAELWVIGQARKLTPVEEAEQKYCLRINADYIFKRAQLNNLSLMAFETNDHEWQHEICEKLDILDGRFMKKKKPASSGKKRADEKQ